MENLPATKRIFMPSLRIVTWDISAYNFVQRFKKVGVIEPYRCGINNLSVILPASSSVSQPLSINPYVNDWSRARYPEYQAFLRNT